MFYVLRKKFMYTKLLNKYYINKVYQPYNKPLTYLQI